jgi:hypothetical protein
MVTFLPSFWLLVPGALGLLTVKLLLSDPARLDGLISVAFTLASIALGTLVGASLYKWLTERFGWWQLQIGRVGRYFGRRNWLVSEHPAGATGELTLPVRASHRPFPGSRSPWAW